MTGSKYELYGRQVPPADPHQEYMTVQETAYVLSCSVSWLRRFLKEHPKMHARQGRRIVTNRADRDAIYAANRMGGTAHRGSKRRTRKTRPALAQTASPMKTAA